MAQLIDRELADRVWNLPGRMHEKLARVERKDKGSLEKDRNEPGIEIAHAAFAQKTRETRHQPRGVASLRNHANARGLQWRQENIGEESKNARRGAGVWGFASQGRLAQR